MEGEASTETVAVAIPKCRNKSKGGVALSDADKAIEDADQEFLKLIAANDFEGAKMCLDAGQDPNVGNENGESAVHLAVMSATDVRLLELLIARGAYVDFDDNYFKRPIQTCIETCNDEGDKPGSEIFKLLQNVKGSSGKPVIDLTRKHPKNQNTLLHTAAWYGNVALGQLLLDTKLFDDNLEDLNKEGQTALHVASFRSPKAMVQALIDAGSNPQAKEKNSRRLSKETPVMMASSMGKIETVKYLKDLETAVDSIKFYTKLKAKKNNPLAGMKK